MKKVLVLSLMTLLASVYGWGNVNEGDEYTWNSTTKTLTIKKVNDFSSGSMPNYSTGMSAAPWNSRSTTADTIILENGFTHIGEYAFYGFSNVKTIIIPASVTSIGQKAFNGCTGAIRVKFAGSPNQWASIDFQGTADRTAQPLAASNQSNRYIWFYHGYNTSYQSHIVFTPGITTIKRYAFANINSIASFSIPASVSSIGNYAFYDVAPTDVAINNSTPPDLGTSVFNTSNNLSAITLYVPTGSKTTYQGTNVWKTAGTITQQPLSGSCSMSSGSATWVLGTDGALTITGHGIISTYSSGTYEWQNFRRLVHKAVIQGDATGDITSIGNSLEWTWAITEITINQTTIPTSDQVGGNGGSSSYNNLFNKRDNVALKIKAASLSDISVSNLDADPWNNAKLTVSLSDAAVFADNADNATWLTNANSYLAVKTFDLQLGRSMSNEYYNTFCSPIDMDASMVTSTFGAGTKIYSFAGTSYDEETDELSLNFNDSQNTIEAGVPYLIQPANNVSNPTFSDIDLSDITTDAQSVEGDHATFYGALAPVDVTSAQISAKSFIFLQAGNQLNWANGGTLGGMRAYWLLTTDVPARALAKRPVMHIGQVTTGIEEVSQEPKAKSQKILRDGQLIILRDGKEYNAQGMLIR